MNIPKTTLRETIRLLQGAAAFYELNATKPKHANSARLIRNNIKKLINIKHNGE